MTTRGSRFKATARLAVVPIAFFALGIAWAFVSPHGSSSDEDWHLVNTWCAWGENEYCEPGDAEGVVLAPAMIVDSWCFAWPPIAESAECTTRLDYSPRVTNRVLSDPWSYSLGFYPVMRIFAGDDVVRSVQVMRVANVLVASTLLALALALGSPQIRRSLSLSWGLTMVPVGVFFVASVNPSSWAISGLGIYWAALWILLTRIADGARGAQAKAAALVLAALIVSLLGRLDSGVYIVAISIAVVVGHPRGLGLLRSPKLIAITSGVALVGIAFAALNWNRWLPAFTWPGAQLTKDMPTPWVKTFLELPSLLVGLFGGQEAAFIQRESELDRVTEGYTTVGFMHGIGWPDVVLPSAVGLTIAGAVVVAVAMAFRTTAPRQVLASIVLPVTGLLVIFLSRAAFGFGTGFQLQARYLFPLALVAVGIIFVSSRDEIVPRGILAFLTPLVSAASSLAWLATSARYSVGKSAAFTNFGQPVLWWWFEFPGRLASFLMVTVITTVWVCCALWALNPRVKSATGCIMDERPAPTTRKSHVSDD